MNTWYKTAKKDKEYLTPDERQQLEERFNKKMSEFQCSFAKDKDGYYAYTHRCRSDSYPSVVKIPKDRVEFVESTS